MLKVTGGMQGLRKIVLLVRVKPPALVKWYVLVFTTVVMSCRGQVDTQFPQAVIVLQPLFQRVDTYGHFGPKKLGELLIVSPIEAM